MGKNWHRIHETLQLSRHPQPRLPPQLSNIRAEKQDGWMAYEAIQENTGLRIIYRMDSKGTTWNHSSLQPYNGFKSLENSHSKILWLAHIKNLILFNSIIRNDAFISFLHRNNLCFPSFCLYNIASGYY